MRADVVLRHIDGFSVFGTGDVVIGNVPVPIVAELTSRGVCYVHLDPHLSADERGRELGPDELDFRISSYAAYRREDVDAQALAFGRGDGC